MSSGWSAIGIIASLLVACAAERGSSAVPSESGASAGAAAGAGASHSSSGSEDGGAVAGSNAAGVAGARVPLAAGSGAAGGSEAAAAAGRSAAGSGGTGGVSSAAAGASGAAGAAAPSVDPIGEAIDIADVWSGHPVGFDLLTHEQRQFAAFYDQNRSLTIASRTLGERTWKLARLPSQLGWDSHNAVVIALDKDGYLHVAGNMHSSPLVYFRSAMPFDASTLQRVNSMVGSDEAACTYPQFFHTADGQLVFMYRSGESGNGNHIFNRYDTAARSWRRLLGSALTDGEGQRNAYPVGPTQGPDGAWHLVWVWRDTADASTNHDLSYARTTDLMRWQSGAGRALALPIRLATSDIVDPVPVRAGMINNNTKVGFDAQKRPIVSYHKYDRAGNTQLYNARLENGAWVVHQTSQWNYRWNFGGNGTLIFEIRVEPVELQADGRLIQRYYHQKLGGEGAFRLAPDTLAAEETIPLPLPYPAELGRPESKTPGMEVHWQKDSGEVMQGAPRYLLRWETLPENRDMPRDVVPPASRLRVYAFPH